MGKSLQIIINNIWRLFISSCRQILIKRNDLSEMKKEDIDWSERIILIPKGKRKKGRIVLFSLQCAEYLKVYLDSRTDNLPYVFLNVKLKNGPIHPGTVGQWFRRYSKSLGFKVMRHTLRHTYAAHCAQKGMPLEGLQVLFGHQEPDQTSYYARLYNHARKEIYDEYM